MNSPLIDTLFRVTTDQPATPAPPRSSDQDLNQDPAATPVQQPGPAPTRSPAPSVQTPPVPTRAAAAPSTPSVVPASGPSAAALVPPPATRPADVVSAAPVRAKGVHTRAGNAMSRTRAALLSGAARAVESSGTKIAMSQVSAAAGVAKATLYNHFRTREAVLDALVLEQARAVVDAQADKPLDRALADAAIAVSANPVRRALARIEPAALAAIGHIDPTTEAWQYARAGVAAALARAGLGGTDTVLRWIASYLLTPAGPSAIEADVAVLIAGLPAAAAGTSAEVSRPA